MGALVMVFLQFSALMNAVGFLALLRDGPNSFLNFGAAESAFTQALVGVYFSVVSQLLSLLFG